MTDRSLSVLAKAQLEKFNLYFAMVIKIKFEGGDLLITDNFQRIQFEGDWYEPGGGFITLGAISEDTDLRNNTTTLTLDGLTEVLPSILMNEDITDRPVIVNRVFLDSNHVIDSSFNLLTANIAGAELDDGDSDIASIKISSHWANFDTINGRRTNSTSQKRHFPNDEGFSFAASGRKEVPWGRGNPTTSSGNAGGGYNRDDR